MTTLNLSNQNLKTLNLRKYCKENDIEFEGITLLDLSNNQLKELPELPKGLKQLFGL